MFKAALRYLLYSVLKNTYFQDGMRHCLEFELLIQGTMCVQAGLATEPPHTWFFGIMLRGTPGAKALPRQCLCLEFNPLEHSRGLTHPRYLLAVTLASPALALSLLSPKDPQCLWTQQNPGCRNQLGSRGLFDSAPKCRVLCSQTSAFSKSQSLVVLC